MSNWRQTPHGEYVCDQLGLVASGEPEVWWAYPFGPRRRLGPFSTPGEAKLALERTTERLPEPQQVRDAAE